MNLPHSMLELTSSNYHSIENIKNDIDDELEFHIHCRTEDLLADGIPKEQAEAAARSAFGSQASIRRQCQRINYGGRIWLSRLAICGLVVAAMAITWLSTELRSIRNQNQLLASELHLATANYSDVAGTVFDSSGNPLADVDVLIVVKTWPVDQFLQLTYATKTESSGHFNYPDLIPNNEPYAVNVSAVSRGYAFKSKYVCKINHTHQPLGTIHFQLQESQPLTAVVKSESGAPIKNVVVHPAMRVHGDEDELVYGASAGPICQFSDETGSVSMDFFAAGDVAQISYKTTDGDWQNHDVTIPGNSQQIEIVARELRNSY